MNKKLWNDNILQIYILSFNAIVKCNEINRASTKRPST